MGGVTYAGLGLSFIAMAGVMFTTISKEWKRNSPESSQANFNQVYNSEGLWVRCNSPLPGQYSCDRYDVPLFGVESYLQAQRAMMILACIFIVSSVVTSTVSLPCTSALNEKAKRYAAMTAGVLAILAAELQAQRAMMVLAAICAVAGVLCGGLGMDCVVAMGDGNSKSKVYTGRTGGGCMLLGGLLTLVAVSWYSSGIIFEYFNPNLQHVQFKYEFGPALYIGWVSSILAIIAGILLLCCNCGATDDTDDYPYNYGPAKPVSASRPNTEYV